MKNPLSCFFITCILLVFTVSKGITQQNDFQFWPSIEVNLEVINNLRIHFEEEVRFSENSSQIGRQLNNIGASYRFNKLVKAGIFYRLEADWKNADEYYWRNGIYGDVALRYGFDRFTAGYRLRIQSPRVEIRSDERLFNGFRHRHKLSLEYDVKGIPLVPFIECEIFVINSHDQKEITGLRTWLGLDYTLKKTHTFSLKYGIDQEYHASDPLRAYIIALGYSLDLSL